MAKTAIKFWASWCAPCKLVTPHFEKMKQEFPDLEYKEIDVDEGNDIVSKYKVNAVPTILLLHDDEEVERLVGAINIASVRASFRKLRDLNDNQS